MFGCWKAFGLIFGWIWRWFWAPSWSQNRPKITQKGSKKQDVILNRFWMALGPILGGFGRQVGSQVGANMAPKSEKWGTKKRSKKYEKKSHARLRCPLVSGVQVGGQKFPKV